MLTIDRFTAEYAFLSNFWEAPVQVFDWTYHTAEHAFQATKMAHHDDAREVRRAPTPGQAKRLGRKLPMRNDWDRVRLSVMEEVLIAKFRNRALRSLLLATGDATLIEGNAWGDTYWGVSRGQGENHLGKLLMKVRTYYKKG